MISRGTVSLYLNVEFSLEIQYYQMLNKSTFATFKKVDIKICPVMISMILTKIIKKDRQEL